MLINYMAEKLKRIDTAENAVRQKLSRILEHMDINPGERNVALNTAIYRVRCGGQVATALNEAIQYARHRELEHARVRLWDEPDGAA